MAKLLLHIAFLGTAYCGYQIQPNGITIQAKLNEASEGVFGHPCDIVGCSRTDSGVHAKEFCATVSKKGEKDISTSIPTDKIPFVYSQHLPDDISVIRAEWVDEDFHARYNVISKEYVYRIYNAPVRDPFTFGRTYHYPRTIDEAALLRMQTAAKKYIGRYDFSSYMSEGSKITDTVRTVYDAEVFRDGDFVCFRICADGFLYNMVRIMAGTLINVAEGKISPDSIESITLSCDRRKAGFTAPPEGLYLEKVNY